MESRKIAAITAAIIVSTTVGTASALPLLPAQHTPISYEVDQLDSSSEMTVEVTDGVLGYQSDASDEAGESPGEAQEEESSQAEATRETIQTTASRTGYYPFQIQYEEQNGVPIIIKSFRITADVDPSVLIESDWKQDGYRYSQSEILIDEPEQVVEEKMVAEPVTFETEKNDEESIRAAISPILDYNEGGFSGQLALDYDSIITKETDTESYSYPIRKTMEFHNLPNNDYAYLDKDLDGLKLESAEWKLETGVQREEDIIPGTYTAIATYIGTGYGTKATGYTSTVYYTGTVKRLVDGDIICSIVYRGEGTFPWTGFFAGLALLAIAGAVVAMILRGIIIVPALGNWLAKRKAKAKGQTDDKPPVEIPYE
ncbi:hypothetical protein H9X81_07525 [Hydrogenoanaerobacterium saccharovorans]|uniref:Ig-like domain (Group 3) n=1 Tax=Hydrogenoanaerobacterium saccharovorans TaxID=474960 RepID=A0ABS2GNJ4_9FIRM|nr:hypothetical protein [Hydrogenoanaerobacterium saccharovorans]MBM6923536.1 hypothetical protein [Hydrogenoanaerobacterium saccharovorans]